MKSQIQVAYEDQKFHIVAIGEGSPDEGKFLDLVECPFRGNLFLTGDLYRRIGDKRATEWVQEVFDAIVRTIGQETQRLQKEVVNENFDKSHG